MENTEQKDKYIWMLYKYSSSILVIVLFGFTLYLAFFNSLLTVPFGCLTVMAFIGAVDKVKLKKNEQAN